MPKSIADRVSRAKRMILADVRKGIIPANAASFADLQEYVDANEYLGAGDDYQGGDDDPKAVQAWIDRANRVAAHVDKWMRAGVEARRRKPGKVRRNPSGAPLDLAETDAVLDLYGGALNLMAAGHKSVVIADDPESLAAVAVHAYTATSRKHGATFASAARRARILRDLVQRGWLRQKRGTAAFSFVPMTRGGRRKR